MSRVDAHHHVWDLSVRDQTWMVGDEFAPIRRSFGIDDLAPIAAAAEVTATVLVQTVGVLAETREFLEVAASNDLVAGVVGWVDLTAPDVADVLAELQARPDGGYLKAIRHQVHDEPDVDWLLRPDVQRGLAAVADAGLGYDLLTKTPHLPAAIQAVKALPQLTFVVDHISKPVVGGPLDPWATQLRELAALPNTTCKLSGLVTEADWSSWTVADLKPYADTVLEAFTPERVMFGSDWPVCLLAAPYAGVVEAAEALTAHLTPAERSAVFATTATETYNLSADGHESSSSVAASG
ncbi:amidohydrolase family protein [Kribbella sandramycini]|uniref:Amidohydrolase family protein n=1 Tax=Kribbella sandramycini TaxID=60450 RepID=A0A7Y4KZP6_9ACTN|nr:amidohydrolase family protein [Kribbella sandramycini]MBB6565366.1 L-fuconolactonase [Kribbella sandramycini]NOL41635.1 amidohydrolase family protein [Kribbella sandramycini]